jgi:hypothetical protein
LAAYATLALDAPLSVDPFTLPAGPLSSFDLTVCQVDLSIYVSLMISLGRKAIITMIASTPGRGGARPKGCGEKGILAYPRCDVRSESEKLF